MKISREMARRLYRLSTRVSTRSKFADYVYYAAEGMPRAFSAIGYALERVPCYRRLNRGHQHVYWHRAGAMGGDYIAAYNLGQCYAYGNGVKKNLKRAVFWWRKAATCGYPKALTDLAVAYYNGWGIRKNRKKALLLFGEASLSGDKLATKNINRLNWG